MTVDDDWRGEGEANEVCACLTSCKRVDSEKF